MAGRENACPEKKEARKAMTMMRGLHEKRLGKRGTGMENKHKR